MATHSHAGHMPSSGKALVISAWLTGIYFVIELAVGLWTGSIAVLSDAFHTLSAVGGVLVAIIAQSLGTLGGIFYPQRIFVDCYRACLGH